MGAVFDLISVRIGKEIGFGLIAGFDKWEGEQFFPANFSPT